MATLPIQRHLARLSGSFSDRPAYTTICNAPTLGYHLARMSGSFGDRPTYVKGPCNVAPPVIAIAQGYYSARLTGNYNDRPAYVLACCGPSGSGSSGSLPSGSLPSGSEASLSTSVASVSIATGSGGSATGILTQCCPNLIPLTLTLTISNRTGTCTCLPGSSIEIPWNGSARLWQNLAIPTSCGGDVDYSIHCKYIAHPEGPGEHVWVLESTYCGLSEVADSVNCDPLELIWTGLSCLLRCSGTYDLTVTL